MVGRSAGQGAGPGLARIVGLVAGCLLAFSGASGATSAYTAQSWGSGSEAILPANAAIGKQQSVSLNYVSCSAVGNCSAVGSYVDSAGHTQGLLMTEMAGSWSRSPVARPVTAARWGVTAPSPIGTTSARGRAARARKACC